MNLGDLGRKTQEDKEPEKANTESSKEDQAAAAAALEAKLKAAEAQDDSRKVNTPAQAETVSYSSHPVDQFKLGRFQFERGVLVLSAEDAKELDAKLAAQPPRVRSRVKKLDLSAANQLAEKFLRGKKTQGIDTSANSVEAPKPE